MHFLFKIENLTFRRKRMNLFSYYYTVYLCESRSQYVDRCLDLLKMIQVYRIFHIIYGLKTVDSCSVAEIIKHCIWKNDQKKKKKKSTYKKYNLVANNICIETGFKRYNPYVVEKTRFYFWILHSTIFFLYLQ